MSVQARYDRDIQQHGYVRDDAQQAAVQKLDALNTRLAARPHPYSLWQRIRLNLQPDGNGVAPVQGLYLWGGVGRGKTYLMDVFYDCAPFENKMRSHFHRFMGNVHAELKGIQSQADPLRRVADRLARKTRLLCFDEFFVADIADAMILGTLCTELFRRGVTLVATSNVPPSDLYRDGLQRQRFLPAIELIERHTEVIHVGGDTDYRLRVLENAEIYHWPADAAADANLQRYFADFAPDITRRNRELVIEGRTIATRGRADGVVWFDANSILQAPRSTADYIEIARCFHTVLIAGVPALGRDSDDAARRLINLVDEFYDRRVKLIMSAQVALDQLYSGERLSFEFERTQSRLIEMQSHDYLAQPHIP